MSLRPMKPIPISTMESSFDSLPYGNIKPYLDDMISYVGEDLCTEFGGEPYFNKINHSVEPYLMLVGEEGTIHMGVYPKLIKGQPFIRLGSIFIRKDFRGKGIGDRIIRKLISLVGEFGIGNHNEGWKLNLGGVILTPTDIVYSDGSLVQNHTFLTNPHTKILVDEPLYRTILIEHTEESDIPIKLRKKRHRKNTKRLKSYYKRFGFRPYGKKDMILEIR